MARLRVIVPAVAIVLGSVVSGAPARSVPASAAASIGFETPTVVDPIHTNGEPDIAIDPQRRVFVSGPTGTGTQRSTWFGSVDAGHTFRVMAQKNPPDPAFSTVAPAPGGGDTDINFDRSGKQYFTDLYALACLRVAVTGPVNSGAVDQENVFPGGCAAIPGADRQWLSVFDPPPGTSTSPYQGRRPLIYLEYNNDNGGAQWNKSTDGLTFVNGTAGEVPPGVGLATYAPFGADGYPAIDQVTGKVFQAAGCDAMTCGTSTTATPGLYLNIGTPDDTGTLHFRDDAGGGNQDLKRLIKIADTPTGSPDTLFSVVSMDNSRTLFAVWCINSSDPSKRQVFVSAASAPYWTNWAPPVQVSDGAIGTDAVNVFPWIKAGGNGMADAVWYGSNQLIDPSTQNGQAWNVFMSQVSYNATSNTLTKLTSTPLKVSPHPMHYDDICLMGSTCITSQGNRNLADFFMITADQTGAAEIVYDDTSNGLSQPGFTPTVQVINGKPIQFVDHKGAGVITVARQSSGTGLLGSPVGGPLNTPVGGLTDPAGDALFPVIGGVNQRGMDIRSSSMQLSPDGKTLNVTMQVVDLSNPTSTEAAIAGTTNLQYVTRWQMGDTIYYAALENTATDQPSFYAGAAQSIDLCSVSACFPHVVTYPEPPPTATSPAAFTGKTESGSIMCPASPSADNPCSLTVRVNVSDIGIPTASSRLEEVGAYAFSATIQEGLENNVTAQSDTVPLQIDGVCCYNFQASVANTFPPPCHEGDGEGDVSDGRGGTAHMRFDADGCKDGDVDSIQENDSKTGDNFQSGRITAVTFNDALANLTILGTGTHNGTPVTFTLVAVNGAAGTGSFSLTLSDGYLVSGTLLSGLVQLQ